MIGYIYADSAIFEITVIKPGSTYHDILDGNNAQYKAEKAQITAIWSLSLEPQLLTTGSIKYKFDYITPNKLPFQLTYCTYYATLERAFYGPNPDYHSNNFINDHPHNFVGYWKIYYPNGRLYTDYHVNNGIHTEAWTIFNDDGSIKGHHYPCENGYHVKYIYDTDQPRETGRITNGKKEGIWTTYYRNGNIESKGSYSNGEKKGEWNEYHENGKLKEEGSYLNDKKVSTWNTYYDDGSTLYETGSYGSYNAGGKNGAWKTYHKNGALKIGCYYNRGYLNGRYEQYRKDGSLKKSGIMEDNEETGIWFESKKSDFVPGVRIPTYTMYPEKKDDEI